MISLICPLVKIGRKVQLLPALGTVDVVARTFGVLFGADAAEPCPTHGAVVVAVV